MTDNRKEAIRRINAGQTNREIAEALGFHIRTVRRWRGLVGKSNIWLPSEDAELAAHYAAGLSWDEMAARLPGRTAIACHRRAIAARLYASLGGARSAAKRGSKGGSLWTEDEIATLRSMYADGASYIEISAKLTGRSVESCQHEAAHLGLIREMRGLRSEAKAARRRAGKKCKHEVVCEEQPTPPEEPKDSAPSRRPVPPGDVIYWRWRLAMARLYRAASPGTVCGG